MDVFSHSGYSLPWGLPGGWEIGKFLQKFTPRLLTLRLNLHIYIYFHLIITDTNVH